MKFNIIDLKKFAYNSTIKGVKILSKFIITLYKGENDYIIAECPMLKGCISQGKTRQEAIDNIKEAIEGYLETLKKNNLEIPAVEQLEVEVN